MNRWQWAGVVILVAAVVGAWAVSRRPKPPAPQRDANQELLDRIRHGGL